MIFAAGTRPPFESCTTPRRVPRGFCATSANGRNARVMNNKSASLKHPRRFRTESLSMVKNRLRKAAVYYHRS